MEVAQPVRLLRSEPVEVTASDRDRRWRPSSITSSNSARSRRRWISITELQRET
ncbi:hypothetical protein [Baaleninema simplex]|uniref:hypothetical protein n=1 Tax=Baaleninema simplex TaxID=2862350 RepID=UPI00130D6EC2|nr:hypothetical protein [Baaleninema simplex]